MGVACYKVRQIVPCTYVVLFTAFFIREKVKRVYCFGYPNFSLSSGPTFALTKVTQRKENIGFLHV